MSTSTPTPTPTLFRFQDPVEPWSQYGFMFLSIFYPLLAFSVVIVMWKRRHTRIVRARSAGILTFAIFYGAFTVVVSCASYIVGKTPAMCVLLSYTYILFLPCYCLPYLLMFPTIVFQSQLNDLKIDRANGGRNWRWKLKSLFKTSTKLTVVFCAIAIQVSTYALVKYLGVVLPGGEDGLSAPGEEQDCYRISLMVTSGYVVFCIATLGAFSLQAIRVADPYFVRYELIINTSALSPMIVVLIVYSIAPQIFPLSFDYRWLPIAVSMTGFMFGVLSPVLLTYDKIGMAADRAENKIRRFLCRGSYEELQMESSSLDLSQSVDAFKAVLEHPVLMAAFTEYLVKNWCVENVLFYKEVENLQSLYPTMSAKERQEKANSIMTEFVMMGAPLEINIEFSTRITIVKAVKAEAISVTTFSVAQKHIYELMKKDSFGKWQRTPQYKQALEKALKKRTTSRSFEAHD